MDESVIPGVLCANEGASHLARGLHDILLTPLPPEALPSLAIFADVLEFLVTTSAESLGDALECDVRTAERGGLMHPTIPRKVMSSMCHCHSRLKEF